jgi:predicted dehydrogenase
MAKRDYAITHELGLKPARAPELAYRPCDPKRYRPKIAVIGCGGVAAHHLTAYRAAGYDVAALCSRTRAKAEARRREFYPGAQVYTDYRDVLRRDDIDVVDVTPHPRERLPILRDAIDAGKHVLSQKPFVTDLDAGERLVERADRKGVKLAVNQNGRWAPHFAYIRAAIAKGLIGRPFAAHLGVHWDHNWIQGTPFDRVRHIVLYDFGIHWFDMLSCFMGDGTPKRVYASNAATPSQKARPPLLGQAIVEYADAQATIVLDADVRYGREDRTYVAGPRGTIVSRGPDLTHQTVTLHTGKGFGSPKLEGAWFPDGFHGTMAELLCSIEQRREPQNSGRNNLRSLALCFAACASAERGRAVVPGTVRRIRP